MTDFAGFPKQTPHFLAALAAHNDRAWMDAHQADYEAHWRAPGCAFVAAAGAALKAHIPDLVVQPKVDGGLFRLRRDTRFSKDKRPYKTHLDVWLWEGAPKRRDATSGFFFRIKADHWAIGAGAPVFGKEALSRYRAALQDKARAAQLLRVTRALEDAGFSFPAPELKRGPAGMTADDPAVQTLLRRKSLAAFSERPLEDVLFTPDVIERCVEVWRTLAPLHAWLLRM